MKIVYSSVITKPDYSRRKFPESKNRSKRIHKKLIKRHGSEYVMVPAIYQYGNQIFAHSSYEFEITRMMAVDPYRNSQYYNQY